MKSQLRCLIVDDEAPAREGMRKLLLAHERAVVVGEAAGVDDALRLMETSRPHVVFLDVQLRGETGFDLLALLPQPPPRIVFVTAHDRYAAQAFRVPALDYLLKPVDPSHLAQALQKVGEPYEPARVPIAHPAALQSLGVTAREAEVLFWIAQGKSNVQIAAILHNSPETVKKQVQKILERLGVDSRVGAALQAARILGLHGS